MSIGTRVPKWDRGPETKHFHGVFPERTMFGKLYTGLGSRDTRHADHVRICVYTRACVYSSNCVRGITSTRVRIPANIDLVLSLPAMRPMKIEFPRLLFETSFSERFIVAFISLRAQEVNLVRSMGSKRFFLLYANGLSMTVSSVFEMIISVEEFLEQTNYFSDTLLNKFLRLITYYTSLHFVYVFRMFVAYATYSSFFTVYKRYAFRKRESSI